MGARNSPRLHIPRPGTVCAQPAREDPRVKMSADWPHRQRRPGAALSPQGPVGTVVTIVLADQSALMHLALRTLLATMPGYAVLAAASTVFTTEQLIGRVRPAMLICDSDIC